MWNRSSQIIQYINGEAIYDYSPWCVVTVSANRQYVTIKALEHQDNTYPSGEKHFWMSNNTRKLVDELISIFEKPKMIQYGKISVTTSTHNKSINHHWPNSKGVGVSTYPRRNNH